MKRNRLRSKGLRLGLTLAPAVAFLVIVMALSPAVEAYTFTEPYNTPWYNTSGSYVPCSGTIWWLSQDPYTSGLYQQYAAAQSTVGLCLANTANSEDIEGLHGGYWWTSGSSGGPDVLVTFSYSFTLSMYEQVVCYHLADGPLNYYSLPAATIEPFAAIWDVSTASNIYGNVYYSTPGLELYTQSSGCGSNSGTEYIQFQCDQTYTVTTSMYLPPDNEYQPRVGLWVQAITNDPNNLQGYAEADLAYYNGWCGTSDSAVLNYINFQDTYPASTPSGSGTWSIYPGGTNATQANLPAVD